MELGAFIAFQVRHAGLHAHGGSVGRRPLRFAPSMSRWSLSAGCRACSHGCEDRILHRRALGVGPRIRDAHGEFRPTACADRRPRSLSAPGARATRARCAGARPQPRGGAPARKRDVFDRSPPRSPVILEHHRDPAAEPVEVAKRTPVHGPRLAGRPQLIARRAGSARAAVRGLGNASGRIGRRFGRQSATGRGYAAVPRARASRIARQMRSGVAGISMWLTPNSASASTIALITTPSAGVVPPSPAGRMPSGCVVDGTSLIFGREERKVVGARHRVIHERARQQLPVSRTRRSTAPAAPARRPARCRRGSGRGRSAG